MEGLLTVESAIALLTLTALEIVLGIDNIVFISVLTGKLPKEQQARVRFIGLAVAMGARIALLFGITWLMSLSRPLFDVPEILAGGEPHAMSAKDLILLAGGLFLIVKATREIHHKIDGGESPSGQTPDPARRIRRASRGAIVAQIVAIDMVFSLDSVLTAIGMVKDRISIMVAAIVIAVIVMMAVAGRVSAFVERYPTIKMLALAFLLLIGVMLTGESFGREIPKGYIYFAMAFSLAVEFLNIRMRRARGLGHA